MKGSERYSYEESLTFLREEADSVERVELDHKRHRILSLGPMREVYWEFRLPLPFPAIAVEESLDDYLERVPAWIPSYMIVLIQAGAAAIGYFEDGEVVHHKAIKKYMKRHKRGKSQISYLNTRGKSKAGSRIRLANTVRFFEEINERITPWVEELEPERILYSCSAQLWGMLFQAKTPPPFEKKDTRLVKVPLDVNIPDFEELLRVNEIVIEGIYTPQNP
ncbi:MAG: hypothetical protein AAFN10_14080 [Bacteroidota bacterium]